MRPILYVTESENSTQLIDNLCQVSLLIQNFKSKPPL